MFNTNPTNRLRKLLLLDAGTCVAMGILLTPGGGLLTSLTAIPAALLFYAGVALFPIAAFMAFTAIMAINSGPAVWLIIAGNVLWVVASLGLMFGEWITPNAFGYAFIGFQAVVVALLAVLEHMAWRRMTREISAPKKATALPSIVGTLTLVALIFGGQSSEALGAGPEVGIAAEKQVVGELLERLVAAVNSRDYEAFRVGLTDDWTYFTSAGRRREFEDWKEIISLYTELHIKITDVHSRLSEDGRLAWSTFRGRIQGVIDGNIDDRKTLFTAIFEQADDEWKLRHLQGTTVPSQ